MQNTRVELKVQSTAKNDSAMTFCRSEKIANIELACRLAASASTVTGSPRYTTHPKVLREELVHTLVVLKDRESSTAHHASVLPLSRDAESGLLTFRRS